MTDRERALLAYVVTVANHVRGFRSVDDLTDRVLRCVREDLHFIAKNAAVALAQGGMRIIEDKVQTSMASFGARLGDLVAGAFNKRSR